MNTARPVILITGSNITASTGFPAFSLNHNYARGVSLAGGVPVIAGEDASEYLQFCAGLLLTGGADVAPERYGAQPATDTLHCDPRRDELEFALARRFLDAGKPILAICRGFQLLNVLLGGSLIQDIPEWGGADHSGGVMHPVDIAEQSVLGTLLGNGTTVNSYHHQAVIPETLAADLRPSAWQTTGERTIIEGFEHPQKPVLAVQWHPERMLEGREERSGIPCTEMRSLFSWLLRSATCSETAAELKDNS